MYTHNLEEICREIQKLWDIKYDYPFCVVRVVQRCTEGQAGVVQDGLMGRCGPGWVDRHTNETDMQLRKAVSQPF